MGCGRALLEREKYDLLKELHNLPANAINRKVNELYKRCVTQTDTDRKPLLLTPSSSRPD